MTKEHQKRARLTELLKKHAARGASPGDHVSGDEAVGDDARLEEDIRPAQPARDGEAGLGRRILLTGATGFLGAHLLHELLLRTTSDVYCLVRGADEHAAKTRIRAGLARYQLPYGSLARVIPLPGDLSRPGLGLDAAQFDDLANTVDTVLHNGAWVHWVHSYRALRATNVEGTRECLRLACAGAPKVFHHVSTMGVFYTPAYQGKTVRESDVPREREGLPHGYFESKWVAEQLVFQALERGLPCRIYRPTLISGSTTTGVWPVSDMFSRLVVACIQAHAVPSVSSPMDLVPVDHVARAIVALASGCEGGAFHVVGQRPLSVCQLRRGLGSLGYPLETVSTEEWMARLRALGREQALFPLMALLDEAGFLERNIESPLVHDVTRTSQALVRAGVRYPRVGVEVLARYIDNFVAEGQIPAQAHRLIAHHVCVERRILLLIAGAALALLALSALVCQIAR